ncbi:Gamma-glutamyltranspeptidase 1 [Trichoplax sp. H2]|nr:Gamma-glutamyltranspeptidase 1 [Trichoplax sp. H2]|eukprot:RDD46417.1 Gamma-glutamyltranspeptidase 1 [Trichoplax sp. H2]
MALSQSTRIAFLIVFAGALVAGIIGLIIAVTGSARTPPPKYFSEGAVAADSPYCSVVGRNMLIKGGTAVDAAIATMICSGTVNLHSTGIGGGGFLVVYTKKTKMAKAYNFRETAPAMASENMYVPDSSKSSLGGLSVGVPGEVRGMYAAWKMHGKLPWKALFEPSIRLAEDGFKVSIPISAAINSSSTQRAMQQDVGKGLKELLQPNGTNLQIGDTMRRPALARTLRIIANEGAEAFYTGSLAPKIVNDIRSAGGIITAADLANYKVSVTDPIKIKIGNLTMYSLPPPSSGIVLGQILSILEGYKFTNASVANEEATVLTYHRIIEAFKFAYSSRSYLGDPKFIDIKSKIAEMLNPTFNANLRRKINDNRSFLPSYYGGNFLSATKSAGTSHMSVLAPNGDAVSVTSTVNLYFGSKVRSSTTGIIYNNEMDDFSTPGLVNAFGLRPSPANFIKPGKRPLSSMSPSIFVDNMGMVKFISGASGGSRITTATALVTMNHLWFHKALPEATKTPRFHNQVYPNVTLVERDFPQNLIDGLAKRGNACAKSGSGAVVQSISQLKAMMISAFSDLRKHSKAAGFFPSYP